MRILHIGDFHYKSNKNLYEQKNVVGKLIQHLKSYEQIDYLVFTGDLVHSGEIESDFMEAHNALFTPIHNALKIPLENIILAPGNHDIDRTECSEAVISYFNEKIKSNDSLNDFYGNRSKDFKSSLSPSLNYYKYFVANFASNAVEHNPLYTIYKRVINKETVGIISLNSAWLSSGFKSDVDNLLFPTVIIKQALAKIEDSGLKILLVHHPLSDFKEFNYVELQDLIHKEFNMMLSGHIHRGQITTQFVANNGIYCNTTQATLSFDKGAEIGYSIINWNLKDNSSIKLERASFSKKENMFIALEPVVITIPCGEEKHKQNRFRQKITSKYNVELNNCNQLLLNYDEGVSTNFIDLFTPPVLSVNSDTDAIADNKEAPLDYKNLVFDDTNYLVFGKDKCGKTSLLKKYQLDLLKNYALEGLVPFYFDYKDYDGKIGKYNLARLTADYYEINNHDAENTIKNKRFVLLIDNFDPLSAIHPIVLQFLEDNRKVKFIICSEYITSRIYQEELDHLDYNKLFFKSITRKEIRLYTEKLPNIKDSDKETVLERISLLCRQLQLPLNYWTISLILLIYKKSNEDYSKNLFGILDLCVDEILNKKHLVESKSKLKFEQYKEICSKLAYYLLKDHRENIYSAEYHEIINFIVECKKNNPRIVGESNDIVDFLITSSILKRKGNRYTFRLNGLFEYFLSYYIKETPSFKDEILSNDGIYLAFKNELEIYSGFNNRDEEFLSKIFQKTKSVFDPIITGYAKYGNLDSNLVLKVGEANEFASAIKRLAVKSPLNHSQQDAIKDELYPLDTRSEVQLKETLNPNAISFELLERYLTILSRVFKNSDGIENLELVNVIFDYLLESYICLGFSLIDEFETRAKEENLKLNPEELEDGVIGEELLKLISRIIPLLVQVMLYEGIGHANLQNIVTQKIEILKKDQKSNQYKLFLLFFLLIDTDITENKDKVDEIFKSVTLSTLKLSTFFKLSFYLAFKAYKNKPLEAFFRNKMQTAQLRLDNKTDIDELQRELSRKQKSNLIKANKEKKEQG